MWKVTPLLNIWSSTRQQFVTRISIRYCCNGSDLSILTAYRCRPQTIRTSPATLKHTVSSHFLIISLPRLSSIWDHFNTQSSILLKARPKLPTRFNQYESPSKSADLRYPPVFTCQTLSLEDLPPPLSSLPLALAIGTHGSWNSRLCTAVLYSIIRMFMHQLIHIPFLFHLFTSPAQPVLWCTDRLGRYSF